MEYTAKINNFKDLKEVYNKRKYNRKDYRQEYGTPVYIGKSKLNNRQAEQE